MRATGGSRRHRCAPIFFGIGILVWPGIVALLWAAAAAFAGPHVTARPGTTTRESVRMLRGLSVAHDEGRLLIEIDVDTPVRYETAMLSEPPRYVLELYGVQMHAEQQCDFSVAYGPVQDVRIAKAPTDARRVRVVVNLREPIGCSAGPAAHGQGMVIVVGGRGLGALGAAPDRPSVGAPRLALPPAAFAGSLWSGFMRAVRGQAVPAALVETPAVAPATRVAALAEYEVEPLTTLAAIDVLPELAERDGWLPKLPGGERTAEARTTPPQMRLLAAALPAQQRHVTVASYRPLTSATLRLPAGGTLADLPARAALASLPSVHLPAVPRRAAPMAPRAVAAAWRAAVTSIWQAPAPERFELHIETSAAVDFRAERLSAPLRYVLHLPNTEIGPECARQLRVRHGVVEQVDVVATDAETSVSIMLREAASCSSYLVPGKKTIVAAIAPRQLEVLVAAQAGARGAAADEPDLIELHFHEADITAVLVALGKYSGKSIVASSSVQGTITVDLSGVTFENALNIVTKLQGYDYLLLDKQTYVVGTAEELAKLAPIERVVAERGQMFTYEPQYTTPDAIAEYFSQFAEDWGIEVSATRDLNVVVFRGIRDDATAQQIHDELQRVDKELPPITTLYTLQHLAPDDAKAALQNYVLEVTVTTAGPQVPVRVIQLRGSPRAIAQAEQVLQTIDVPAEEVPLPVEALVVEMVVIDHQDPEEIQTTLAALYPEGLEVIVHSGVGSEAELSMTGIRDAGALRKIGTILLRGEPSIVAKAVGVIEQLDAPLPRVQISTSIIEVSYTKSATVGLIWTLPGIVFNEGPPVDGWRFGTFIRDPWTLSAMVTAVDSKARTRVLSSPKIVVESTKLGKILVGSIIPFETSVPGEGTVTRSLNFQEVGLGVDFAPVVKSDGTIEMYIRPHVSNFAEFTPSGFPRIDTREATTIMWAKDGDTIIIGGLLQEQESITKSGIPFLRDFPFIGELFSQRTKSRQKSEVVIMATIELLAAGSPAAGAPATVVVPPA